MKCGVFWQKRDTTEAGRSCDNHCVSVTLQIAQIEIENTPNGKTSISQKLPYISNKFLAAVLAVQKQLLILKK